MPLSENTAAFKIYIKKSTLQALRLVAEGEGVSVSALIIQAAVEKYLGSRSNPDTRLASLEKKIRELESYKISVSKSEPEEPKPKRIDEFPQTFKQSSQPVLESSNEQIQLDRLVERLGGTSSLKARLCQLGGRDGLLFQGDLGKALKVEEITKRLDPEGKSWLPLAPNRLIWIQITAKEFCKMINSKE
jgi:hypothetical protein